MPTFLGYCFDPDVSLVNVCTYSQYTWPGDDSINGGHSNFGRTKQCAYVCATRRKLETVFSIAVSKGHDSIIVPFFDEAHADVIVHIFRAVCDDFAGRFRKIVFITQNAKAHDQIRQFFDQSNPIVPLAQFHFGGVNYRPAETKVCDEGGICSDHSNEHRLKRYHPPMCLQRNSCHLMSMTTIKDALHCALWAHKELCGDRAFCHRHEDTSHCKLFIHPTRCKEWLKCQVWVASYFI